MYQSQALIRLLKDKRILLAGYGREGKSSHRLIKELLPNAEVTVAEGNDAILSEVSKGYDLIIKSPGIPTFIFEGVCPLNTITSQTDLFLQTYASQTLGVTGTKGKSTTTNLLAAIMQRCNPNTVMAGNMGIPLFDIIPQLNEQSLVVAEFSCHQLENIHRAPHTSILLNLFQEHLDHYHSYLDYQLAKLNIALQQHQDDSFFYCSDNAELATLVEKRKSEMKGDVISYSLHSELAQHLSTLPRHLQGDHNLSNLVAVFLAARSLGAPEDVIYNTISDFKGLEHRLGFVATKHNITFYNDSISTIPEACEAAVGALKQVDTLILGGFDRGIDYSSLGKFLASSAINNLVFVGAAGKRILEEYQIANPTVARNLLIENDYEKIVPWCFSHTTPGEICLLSPAAASYDAFKNFEERGRKFKQLILETA